MAKPTMNADTYQRILSTLADARRQTAGMVRSGRRDGLTEPTAVDMEAFQLFSEAYQNADSLEELMRRMG